MENITTNHPLPKNAGQQEEPSERKIVCQKALVQ
jgi:hypothetical protein